MGNYKYKAFISYSHKDKHWARWLHRRLETYAFPKHAVGSQRVFGAVPKNLKPIFRDGDELAAAEDLGAKIETALSQSETLIIMCSPAAASSHWVNQEVLYFKQHNRGARIFSVIIDGEPYATNMLGREAEECLPRALRFKISPSGEVTDIPAEPLYADLRMGGDGKRLGLLKLISGMVGLGLDDLVQRDLARARRRVMAITVNAISAVLIMGTLTWLAMDARQEAETRRAEAEAQRTLANKRTASAEELIEFMVTDLKDKLEPVGRLDALKVVGEQASQYYDQYPLTAHDDDALGRRARVFHYLGEIQDKLGKSDEAESYFADAYEATESLLQRDPETSDRLFNHAQSAYWIGYSRWVIGDTTAAQKYWHEYLVLAKNLVSLDPLSPRAVKELAYAEINMGVYLYSIQSYGLALESFLNAKGQLDHHYKLLERDYVFQRNYGDLLGWISKSYAESDALLKGIKFREDEIKFIQTLLTKNPSKDWEATYILASAYRNLARLRYLFGDSDAAKSDAKISEKIFSGLTVHDSKNLIWQRGLASTQALLMEIYGADAQLDQRSNYSEKLRLTLTFFESNIRPDMAEIIKDLDLQ